MITFLTEVTDEASLDRFKLSLTLNQGAFLHDSQESRIIIIRNSGSLVECLDYVDSLFERGVPAIGVRGRSWKKIIQEYVGEKGLVLVNNGSTYMPANAVSQLLEDYVDHPNAGLITGHFIDYPVPYWVEEASALYGEERQGLYKLTRWDKRELESGLNKIDTVSPYGFITKARLLREWYGDNKTLGIQYGVNLRRAGYQNYLDTRVPLRQHWR